MKLCDKFRQNKKVWPYTVQDFVSQVGNWIKIEKKEKNDSVRLEKVEDVLKESRKDHQTVTASSVENSKASERKTATIVRLQEEIIPLKDMVPDENFRCRTKEQENALFIESLNQS